MFSITLNPSTHGNVNPVGAVRWKKKPRRNAPIGRAPATFPLIMQDTGNIPTNQSQETEAS